MRPPIKKLPFFLCYLIAFVFGIKQLREPDIWWQLLSGRWMLEHGAITRTDVFSYTMYGHRWVNVKWLYEIFIHLLEKGLGPEGVILLQAVVNVGILWALFHTLKQIRQKLNIAVPDFATIIAALLFFIMVEYRMTGRPEMMSHLMCALFLSYIWCYPELNWKQFIWPLILQCLWANMHEAYPVGLVIVAAYAAGSFIAYILNKDKIYLQTAQRAGLLFLAAAVVILINPNGIQLWKQPFEIYRQVLVNKYTTELFSYKDAEYWTIQAKLHMVILIAAIIFWGIRIIRAIKQKDKKYTSPLIIASFIWIVLFGYLSLSANRNIPFAQIALFPSVAIMLTWLSGFVKAKAQKPFSVAEKYALSASIVIPILFYISIVSNKYYKATKSVNLYGVHTSILHNPAGAAAFIQQYGVKGRAFSDYFVSSYLLWALYPDFKSYIDLRDLDIFPAAFFDDYFSIYNQPNKFYDLDKKYNFNYAIFSTSQMTALQERLYWGNGYNLVYVDPVCCIFLKTNKQNEALNNNWQIQKMFTWPAAPEDPQWADLLTRALNPAVSYENEDEKYSPIYAAKFYNEMRNFPSAIKLLRPAMNDLEDNADANLAMGNSYLKYAAVEGDTIQKKQKADSARSFLERAQQLDPDKEGVYLALADLSFMYGNFREGADNLEHYIKLNDHNDYVYYLLGLAYRELWMQMHLGEDIDETISAMNHSLKLNPGNGKAYLYLSEAYVNKKDMNTARTYLMKAIKSGNQWQPVEQKIMEELKTKLNAG
jgi:tetratricopeptide (TPR) repeat protein